MHVRRWQTIPKGKSKYFIFVFSLVHHHDTAIQLALFWQKTQAQKAWFGHLFGRYHCWKPTVIKCIDLQPLQKKSEIEIPDSPITFMGEGNSLLPWSSPHLIWDFIWLNAIPNIRVMVVSFLNLPRNGPYRLCDIPFHYTYTLSLS